MLATTDIRTRTIELLRGAGCVFADDEAGLLIDHAADEDALDAMVRHRVSGTPLEVVLGWAMFGDLRVYVAAGVFVPRRRTLFLASTATEKTPDGGIIVDLCCGTGAVGLAVARDVPGVELHAADIDRAAIACAERNLAAVHGHTYCGDLFAPLPDSLRDRVDVVAVNAPYVPSTEIALMPPEARDHEPRHALDGGPDGVDLHRRIAAEAGDWLRPGGYLLIETSRRQASLTSAAMTAACLASDVATSDDLDATVVIGVR